MRLRSLGIAVVLFAVAALGPRPALAQTDDAASDGPAATGATLIRPASARRVVRVIGFNEAPIDPNGVPEGWVRAQEDPGVPRVRPGFPLWNEARVDVRSPAFEGAGSVRLPTRGGSTSLMLRTGLVSVLPSAHYLVTAQVRTEGLGHARARMAARFLDQSGAVIAGSERMTPPILSDEGWTLATLLLRGDHEAAAFLQIELLLLQPREFERVLLPAPVHAWPADYEGSAWFDEVAILQAPRVEMTAAASSGVVAAREAPELTMVVRDLAGEPLWLEASVQDARGEVVDRRSDTIAQGHLREAWRPALPGYGWYRAVCRVRNAEHVIGATSLDFIWMPEPSLGLGGSGFDARDRRQVGLTSDSLATSALAAYAEAAEATGVGLVQIPLMPPDADVTRMGERSAAIAEISGRLAERATLSGVVIAELPESIAGLAGVEPSDVLGLFALGEAAWGAEITTAIDLLGEVLRSWQLGGHRERFERSTAMLEADLSAASASLSRLVPSAVIGLPASSERPLPMAVGQTGRVLSLDVPDDLDEEGIDALVRAWAEQTGYARERPLSVAEPAELHLVFNGMDNGRSGVTPRASASAVLRRGLAAWDLGSRALAPATHPDAATPIRLVLRDPWGSAAGDDAARAALRPAATLAAWRTLTETLVGRRVSANPLRLGTGMRAVLLEPVVAGSRSRGAVLAVWQDEPASRPLMLEMLLATQDVTLIDVFGNRRPLAATDLDDRGVRAHVVPIGDEPLLIEGVDPELVRFQASVRLEPPMLVARHTEHLHSLVIDNPWPVNIRGRYFIIEPGGAGGSLADTTWRITPRHGPFSAFRGESTSAELAMRFSAAEEAGPKTFVIDLEVAAHKDYGRVRVKREVPLALPDVDFDLTYFRGTGNAGSDLFVEVRVLNTGAGPINAEVRMQAPGFPRDVSLVTDLGPEESVLRVFPLRNGAELLPGKRISVALVLPDGRGRLTRSIDVPDLRTVTAATE